MRRPSAEPRAEQVARELVDPVAVLEDDDERLVRCRAARHDARRSSSDALRSFASNERVSSRVRDCEADDRRRGAARGRRGPGSIAPSSRLERRDLGSVPGSSSSSRSTRRQTSRQREVRSCSCRTPGTRRRRRAGRVDGRRARTPRPAATCPSRLGRDPENAAASRVGIGQRGVQRRRAPRGARRAPSSNRILRRDARSSEPWSASRHDRLALPLTVRSGRRSQMNASPGLCWMSSLT